jgi:nondiscriminating aspartyl-tRNA synthetase
MERIYGAELGTYVDQKVKVAGWVHNIRKLGKVNFLRIRDVSGVFQVFLTESEATQLDNVSPESVVELQGTVVAEAQAPGGYEIHQPEIMVLSRVTEGLPFSVNQPVLKAHLDTFLDYAPFGLRYPKKRALFRLSAGVMQGFRTYLDQQGFTEIATPKLVESATESGANVFAVNYFDRLAYLAQSPQFYKQIMVGIFEKVYEVAPVFRAEPHATIRHLNEYVSMDVEMGFIKDHFDVMALLSQVLRAIFAHLQTHYTHELNELEVQMPAIPDVFPHIHFPDAQEFIYQHHQEDCRGEPDLAPQHERWLGEWAKEEYQSDFLFVTGYPMKKRPFYTHPDPENPIYSNSFDLLFRGTELVTGGQRLHLYEDYLQALQKQGISDPQLFAGYLQAFRYGMPPHGGFAIGLERLLMQLTGAANLRETVLFPRDINRLSP